VWGAPQKLEDLKLIAAGTKDKPVTILADLVREKDTVKAERLAKVASEQLSLCEELKRTEGLLLLATIACLVVVFDDHY